MRISRKRLKKSRCKEITEKIMDQVVDLIVEKKMGLREIAFRLNVPYAVLIRHVNEDQKSKELIDEAVQWTLHDLGQELVAIADKSTKDTRDKDRFRVQARKDAVNLLSRHRESVARSRPVNQAPVTTVQVGVVVVPHKAMPAPHAVLEQPRLAAVNGQLIEAKVLP